LAVGPSPASGVRSRIDSTHDPPAFLGSNYRGSLGSNSIGENPIGERDGDQLRRHPCPRKRSSTVILWWPFVTGAHQLLKRASWIEANSQQQLPGPDPLDICARRIVSKVGEPIRRNPDRVERVSFVHVEGPELGPHEADKPAAQRGVVEWHDTNMVLGCSTLVNTK
jgi:hypothetical protein